MIDATKPVYQWPITIEPGKKPEIPLRVAEKRPVTLDYAQALWLRQVLANAAGPLRRSADLMECDGGTDRCQHCRLQSVADDCDSGKVMLRGERR